MFSVRRANIRRRVFAQLHARVVRLENGTRIDPVSGDAWTRYVALGDSITEGFCDPAPAATGPAPGPGWFGWADRLAVILDGHAQLGRSMFEFANLAVRGRRISHVVDEQIPRAISLRADLVSVMIGGNDLMSAKADPDGLAARLDAGIREFQQTSMWAADRVHLSTLGHQLLAARAAHVLGIPYAEIAARTVSVPDTHSTPSDALPLRTWLRVYAIPWAGRRLRGVSAGDGLSPKLPVPCRVGAPQ